MMISLLNRLENAVGKGVIAVFSKAFFLGVVKNWDRVVKS